MSVKICHITSAHMNTDVRILEKECASLAKIENYEVYLVGGGESYIKNNVKVVGMGDIPKSRKERSNNFAKKVIKKAIEIDADIYHLHDPELLRFSLTLKKKGKKVIYDSHEDTVLDIYRKDYIPKILRPIIAFAMKKYLANFTSRIDAVVTVTPDIVQKYKKYNGNVYLVTNYPIIDTEKTQIESKKNSNIVSLFFAGGVSSMWSHDIIVDVLNEFDDIKYELYGVADDSYLEFLNAKESWKKVNYHGKVPFDEVDRCMWDADIGIALMQYIRGDDKTGTLGNTKIFEMMLHGLPVIATDYILWKEIIEDKNCGICINPNNIEELKQAIEYLINNREKASNMGKNGRKLVLTKYNWETQEKELYDVYKALQNI